MGDKKIEIEKVHQAGAKEASKDRTIVAKLGSYKGKQSVLN